MRNRECERVMAAFPKIDACLKKKLEEYAENVIAVPAERRWDYAIPENYTNYHDGFLFQDGEPYNGMPIIRYEGKTLYLHRALNPAFRSRDEDEKLLLFDRQGRKYTFIVTGPIDFDKPNPSYFDFLPKVKPYKKQERTKQAF